MGIRLIGQSGETPVQAVQNALQGIVTRLDRRFRTQAGPSFQKDVCSHITHKYPGSSHWNTAKVKAVDGGVTIDIPGASRAYHAVSIQPRYARYLKIPMGDARKGLSESVRLFFLKKRNGKAFLAYRTGNGLAFAYFLAKSVHQSRDPSLLPSGTTLLRNLLNRILQPVGTAT